jgi:hypothetical protein
VLLNIFCFYAKNSVFLYTFLKEKVEAYAPYPGSYAPAKGVIWGYGFVV